MNVSPGDPLSAEEAAAVVVGDPEVNGLGSVRAEFIGEIAEAREGGAGGESERLDGGFG